MTFGAWEMKETSQMNAVSSLVEVKSVKNVTDRYCLFRSEGVAAKNVTETQKELPATKKQQ